MGVEWFPAEIFARLKGEEGRGVATLTPFSAIQESFQEDGGDIRSWVEEVGSLEELHEIVKGCQRCGLHRFRQRIVFGKGAHDAKIVVVGDAPGVAEEASGAPFVGDGLILLQKMLDAIGVDMDSVYLAPALKCRLHKGRSPRREEVDSCGEILFAQLRLISPKAILLMGAAAARAALGRGGVLTKIRGKVVSRFGAKIVATYNPSFILNSPPEQQAVLKRIVWHDLKLFRDRCLR